MRESKLTLKQKERLKILEPKLKDAVFEKNYTRALEVLMDIQMLLRVTGHITRLVQSKNRFYELAIDCDKLDVAIEGLKSNREVVSTHTRLYLEASTLLAIAYLRKGEIENARPIIKEVITNDKVIKTERTRAEFRKEVMDRFDQEIALASLKNMPIEEIDSNKLEIEIVQAIQQKNEFELYESIGKLLPQKTKDYIFQVREFSTKLLPSAERLALPSPNQSIKDEEVGKTVFKSVKRVIYNSLCNKESDIYKAWFNNGMQVVLSKGYITSAVASLFVGMGIGVKSVVVWVVALIIKFGLEVYCDRFKPKDLMDLRG